MDSGNQTINSLYAQELNALHTEGVEFAKSHPDVAAELGMGTKHWNDPQAEMLLQSFAFLSARIRNQLEVDKSAVPNALLNYLYPHLQAPLPCMAIARAQASLESADGRALERGRIFTAEADSGKRKTSCRLKNAYNTPVWPLEISRLTSETVRNLDFLPPSTSVTGALKVELHSDCKDPIQDLPLADSGLRFYLGGPKATASHLYELLSTSLQGIYLQVPGKKPRRLDASHLRWCGFRDDEAMLPDSAESHPGYRLLREYFAFPQKFMFFDVEQLNVEGAHSDCTLYFLFDEPISSLVDLSPDCLQLNCFPVINLFEQAIEPIRLTQKYYEYQVTADRRNLANSEIYRIVSLFSIVNGEEPQAISPLYELSEFDADDDNGYFYTFRREHNDSEKIPGTRTYLSLHNSEMDICAVPAEAIGGSALCTNRRLPEKLHPSAQLHLEGPGPLTGAQLVSKISEYGVPQLTGKAPWQLVSQLRLNFLSIADGQRGLESFKSILSTYTDPRNTLVWKQINSLKQISSRRVARLVRDGNSSGVGQGLQIRLKINEGDFKGVSPVLFASVCRYFFVLYANLGTFVELVLESNKDRGDWKIWPPMAGALVEL